MWAIIGCGAVGPGEPRALAPDAAGTRTLPPEITGESYVLVGAELPGRGVVDIVVEHGTITAVGSAGPEHDGLGRVELDGRWIVPAFIDSHVHLAYFGATDLTAGGIAGAVDLAAPLTFLARDTGALTVVHAGPMLTAPDGYPTRSWGADGYGIAVDSPHAARDAIDVLAAAGAKVVKLPLEYGPRLDEATLVAAVDHAHANGMKVAVHALGDREAALAARIGADVLAHTPLEPLRPATAAAWRHRAVIGTLAVFGAAPSTLDNLAALRAAGATVLYGTDLGNSQVAAIDPAELAALRDAGLTPTEILDAGTRVPAQLWGFTRLGEIAPGKAASLLVLAEDPLLDPLTIARPIAIVIEGRLLER
jgi:imidazolonepropionase-like amidohydrolase